MPSRNRDGIPSLARRARTVAARPHPHAQFGGLPDGSDAAPVWAAAVAAVTAPGGDRIITFGSGSYSFHSPAAFFVKGDGQNAAEPARLKGMARP